LDIDSEIELAKQRYFEIFGIKYIEIAPINILYEIKYSKTAGVWTIYKLFNYVNTKIEEKEKALSPQNMQVKLFDLNNDNFDGLVLNAIEVVRNNKKLLLNYCQK